MISWLVVLGLVVCTIGAVEAGFRIQYRKKTGQSWRMIRKIPFQDLYVEPHPYLPYVYKRNFIVRNEMAAHYPLHVEKGYTFGQYRTNSMRFMNGQGGEREMVVPKPENTIRINCLGASVGALYLRHEGKDYSYPMELESLVENAVPGKKVEVNNCSAGLRTSAEIFIDFALNIIDTKPDIVIYYHGFNDLTPSLTPDFSPDYSHARRNLGETYYLYKISSIFPDIPLASYNYLLTHVLGGNIRFSLTRAISRRRIDTGSEFQGLQTYRRNVEHIINLCKANGIAIVLSTFCHFMHEGIRNDPLQAKYHLGVIQENAVIMELARIHQVPVVDNFNLVPADSAYFVDHIHFSPEGMRRVAENFSVPLVQILIQYKGTT